MLYVMTRITEGYLVVLLYTKAFIREGGSLMFDILGNLSDIGSFMLMCYMFYRDNRRNECR